MVVYNAPEGTEHAVATDGGVSLERTTRLNMKFNCGEF